MMFQSPVHRGWYCTHQLRAPTDYVLGVSIPCSSGLVLHRADGDTPADDSIRFQSPVHRGWYCTGRQEGWLRRKAAPFQSPVHRGWYCTLHITMCAMFRASSFQSPVHRGWYCTPGRRVPGHNEHRVSIPCSSGLVLHCQVQSVLGDQLLVTVSIPCSSGLVLHAMKPCRKSSRKSRSFNPLFIGAGTAPPGSAGPTASNIGIVSIPCSSGLVLHSCRGHPVDDQIVRCFNPLFIGAGTAQNLQTAAVPAFRFRFNPLFIGAGTARAGTTCRAAVSTGVSIPCSSGLVLHWAWTALPFGPPFCFNPLFIGAGTAPCQTELRQKRDGKRFQSPVHRGWYCTVRAALGRD